METSVHDLLTPIVAEKPLRDSRPLRIPWQVKVLRAYFATIARFLPGIAARQAIGIFGTPKRRYLNKPASKVLSKSRQVMISSQGLKINIRIWDNTGPTVLLVHGWETSGLHLFSFVEPLWSLGFRIVAMDGPAHGESEGTYTNLVHFAKAIEGVVHEAGPVHHIIGHSFGGVTSVYLAATSGMALHKMVLISVPNNMLRIISDFCKYLRIPALIEKRMQEEIKKTVKVDPNHIEISSLGQKMNVREVLVVHDRYDSVVPFYNALEITHAVDQACLLPTEYLGHNRILKNPRVTTRVAQYLNDQLIH